MKDYQEGINVKCVGGMANLPRFARKPVHCVPRKPNYFSGPGFEQINTEQTDYNIVLETLGELVS